MPERPQKTHNSGNKILRGNQMNAAERSSDVTVEVPASASRCRVSLRVLCRRIRAFRLLGCAQGQSLQSPRAGRITTWILKTGWRLWSRSPSAPVPFSSPIKNYQSQTQAKPSELARLELWSKLLAEAGIDIGDLPPEDEITAEQREILENYRVSSSGHRSNRSCVRSVSRITACSIF